MIAILDARPGMASQLREVVAELVRREPGCLTFTAYQARDTPGRFYLDEVHASAAAFDQHLQTQHVHDFIAAVPANGATHAYCGDRRDSCRARR
ncbi:MAG TPA: putative quinol monooxygenase [Streptosporangiaceae bacterium]|jgi:quinol monooxygenase YgiN